MSLKRLYGLTGLGVLLTVGCTPATDDAGYERPADPFVSTYEPLPSTMTLIQNATILTGTGERIDSGSVLIENGRIAAIGGVAPPDGATIVDATGKWVTPGI